MAQKTYNLKRSQFEVDKKTGKIHLKIPEGLDMPENLKDVLADARPTISISFRISW